MIFAQLSSLFLYSYEFSWYLQRYPAGPKILLGLYNMHKSSHFLGITATHLFLAAYRFIYIYQCALASGGPSEKWKDISNYFCPGAVGDKIEKLPFPGNKSGVAVILF